MNGVYSGLSNNQALNVLRKEILDAVSQHRCELAEDSAKLKWHQGFLHPLLERNNFSPYFWTSAALTFAVSLVYLASYFVANENGRYSSLIGECVVLLLIVGVNIRIARWIDVSRSNEIPHRCEVLAKKLAECAEQIHWGTGCFPNLFTPLSPCIAVQWAVRDGLLVNVPWALLVAGDIILLKPGQEIPGKCVSCDEKEGKLERNFGDVYAPDAEENIDASCDQLNVPHLRSPSQPVPHRLLESPVMNCIKYALKHSTIRPSTVFERERQMVMNSILEHTFLPLLVIISVGVNVYRYFYLEEWSGCWMEMFVQLPTVTVLPLIPLAFPAFWLFANFFGSAKIFATFHTLINTTNRKCFEGDACDRTSTLDEEIGETNLILPDPCVENVGFFDVLKRMKRMLLADDDEKFDLPGMWLSSNLLHVLGSVTALCCIDKKGILSWPNPVADKVFFFHHAQLDSDQNVDTEIDRSSETDEASSPHVPSSVEHEERYRRKFSFDDVPQSHSAENEGTFESVPPPEIGERSVVPEVLDLYLDPNRPFHLQFDDPHVGRGRHLKCLKPLGLAALLNTCNPETQNHYAHFCSHITAQAMYNEALVPVTNRRCLCELAHQIGFSPRAGSRYELCDQLATFRHVEASLVQSSRLAKSLSTAASARLKFPFPHMVGVVVREAEAGGCQLLSQGTADIVLDCCIDLWDGRDLVPLNDGVRKKVLDFYHRSSLTAYCTAFAYCPILFPLGGDVSMKYLELPPEGHQVNYTQSPTPIPLVQSEILGPGGKLGQMRSISGQYMSNDSLMTNCPFDITEANQEPASSSAWACLMAQSQQVFLGMVTMQYQARPPLVHLVEQLETACIRFVHFSKENELRSRVFSEKMGLESGWNCHVSLLSEMKSNKSDLVNSKDAVTRQSSQLSRSEDRKPSFRREKRAGSLVEAKPHSFSAPSNMNLEVPQQDDDVFEYTTVIQHKRNVSEAVYFSKETINDMQLVEAVDKDIAAEMRNSSGMGKAVSSVSQESSHFTDSTDQTAPVPFDMSNRAKLPRGIENIRPHLNQVDNVPLLVSLFTDCTPSACEEMVRIMQDYDQVVCVLGSTASAHNTEIFLQADAALGIEPLYPQVCMKVPVTTEQESAKGMPSPTDVSHLIMSLPCALSFRTGEPLVIFELISEARNFMKNARNALQFWLCASGGLCLIMLFSSCCLLPPILRPNHLLTLGSIISPMLAVGLVANPVDDRVMTNPTGKLQTTANSEASIYSLFLYALWFYGMKFFPSIFAVLAIFLLTLRETCTTRWGEHCVYVFKIGDVGTWGGWNQDGAVPLLMAQNLCAILIALYYAAVSVSFVHRVDQIWTKNPLHNRVWCCGVVLGVMMQVLFSVIDLVSNLDLEDGPSISIPLWAIIIAGLWPMLAIVINEGVKRREILVTVRYLKRARLEFGTKLGMNSPF